MIEDKIYNLKSFKSQYNAILSLSVSLSIEDLIWSTPKEELESQIHWNNVLGMASILSYSQNSDHLEAALRISQTCLMCNRSEEQKSGAIVILENLTNIPALNLAVERGFISKEYENNLSLPYKLLTNKVKINNSVNIQGEVVSLNRFQKQVFDSYEVNTSLSISAPTSAGKSFILYQLLLKELKGDKKNIVYVVPTRALISQVEEDLRLLISKNELSDIYLSTVPLNEESSDKINLFVFTQERLHWFLIQSQHVKIDFLIIDEAHKIDNGNRGVLLQRKIEDVVESNPNIKIFFSSPFTSNPEILLDSFDTGMSKGVINTEFVAVNQNLIYVTQVKGHSKLWEIDLIIKDHKISIGRIELNDRPTTVAKKMALITEKISGSEGGSLIYANRAVDAEKYSKTLLDLVEDKSEDSEINDLIDLTKKSIHSNYSLSTVLKNKIAFHYGNMPLLIRQEIESLFKKNKIKYLICTSTLLEGVNLPATAVFIRKPTRGVGNPLNENDFWNLAGRAGRWGKEFSGNIVCIDPQEWEIEPSPNKRKQKITKALDIIRDSKRDDFFKFIDLDTPREIAESNQDLEFAFSYYYSRYIQGLLVVDSEYYNDLRERIENIEKKIQIPDEIILRNPGISPIAQQELYKYFESKSKNLESLIPVYPEDENAYVEYTRLVGRIGKTLAKFPPQLNSTRAILLINWMSGKPLSYLISNSIKSYKKKGKQKSVDSVCREVMEQVENFARFRFAKESSCYVDILRLYFRNINREDLLPEIPDLNLWLEFGVSQKTQLSLLSLGLSRNSTIAISEYIINTNMTKDECLNWLREKNLQQYELSPIILSDIEKIILVE